MINSSVPILQIKTSGFNLLEIKTINILIKNQEWNITKENKDLEIDGDIISVYLTQNESSNLNAVGTFVSIEAINLEDVDISKQVKIVWIKKASKSTYPNDGDYVNIDVFNQKMLDIDNEISDLENGLTIGNSRVYLDYKDGKYGVNTDPERGADTFSPFKTDQTSGITSPITIPFQFNGQHGFHKNGRNLDVRSYLPDQIQTMVKKIIIREMTVKVGNLTSGKSSVKFYFRIYGKNEINTPELCIYNNSYATVVNQTYEATYKVNDYEINTQEYEYITSFGAYATYWGTIGQFTQFSFTGTMEVHFEIGE